MSYRLLCIINCLYVFFVLEPSSLSLPTCPPQEPWCTCTAALVISSSKARLICHWAARPAAEMAALYVKSLQRTSRSHGQLHGRLLESTLMQKSTKWCKERVGIESHMKDFNGRSNTKTIIAAFA